MTATTVSSFGSRLWMERLTRLCGFIVTFGVGTILWMLPAPEGMDVKAWHLLAIFLSALVGIVAKPLPMGAISVMALAVATLSDTLTTPQAFAYFSSDFVWLVILALFIARGVIKTGLGARVAYCFVRLLGKSTLGLGYGLLLSDFVLSPAIPSVAARAGGVVFPIAFGLAKSYDANGLSPDAARKNGGFLMAVAYQGSVITSAMFLTAMAANPIIADLAQSLGHRISWAMWALAAIVPGLLSLLAMPLIINRVAPPHTKKDPQAVEMAKAKLKEMGKMSRNEWLMAGIFGLLLFLWITGPIWGIKAVSAALLGISLLVLTKILSWEDILKEESAWNTFIWFATLVTLASNLNTLGCIPWMSGHIIAFFDGWSWYYAFPVLTLIYFYSHYLFASNTAHVGAMYLSFATVAIGFGTPPLLAILLLAFLSNLFGGLTHYSSSPGPIYFGAGYFSIGGWWAVGGVVSLAYLVIWGGVGTLWWKLLGLW